MILITGAKGMIGTKLMKELDAVGIDLKDGQNLLTCDLPTADIIIHLAAQTSVEASWHDPVHDMDNVRMVARLVHAYPNARIIHANSAASLDQKSPYGFSKWAGGEYLKAFHLNYVDLVFPNIYGGDKSVVDLFKDQKEVTIYGDGLHVRDYVHVDDIVEGIIKSMNWPTGKYFMGSGIGTTVLQLAEGKTVTFKEARKEARESVLQNTTPDWKPMINVLEYIQ